MDTGTSEPNRPPQEQVQLEDALYDNDPDLEDEQSTDSIANDIIAKGLNSDQIMELNLSAKNVIEIGKFVNRELINLSKRIQTSKNPKTIDKTSIVTLSYAAAEIWECIELTHAKEAEMSYRDNILKPHKQEELIHNLARENAKIKKRKDKLEWKYKDYEEVKMGKKMPNGAISQTFYRSAISECCKGYITKQENTNEETNKRILDSLNSNRGVITTNRQKTIEINSSCHCSGKDQRCKIKMAKDKLEIIERQAELKIVQKRLPALRVISTNKDSTIEQVWAEIKNDLPESDLEDTPRLITQFIHRSERAKSFIIEVQPKTRANLAGRNMVLKESKVKIYIRDSIHITYCRYCDRYGHSLARCRNKPANEQITYEQPPKCSRCTDDHSPFDLKCKQRYRFIASRIQNIDYGEKVFPMLSLWQ